MTPKRKKTRVDLGLEEEQGFLEHLEARIDLMFSTQTLATRRNVHMTTVLRAIHEYLR